MDKNNVQMSDEELLQFRMFQEQMRGIRPYESSVPVHADLSRKELRKSTYVRRTLSNDEYIVKVAMLHPFAYFWSFVLMGIGAFLLYVMYTTSTPKGYSSYFPYHGFFSAICFLCGFCKYLNLRMMEMVVTTKRVICKSGIISVNTEELKNPRIESVEIKQSLWQRIWFYADIYFTGTGGSYVLFSNIKDARSVKSTLEDTIDV